jgi:hypothetical protein
VFVSDLTAAGVWAGADNVAVTVATVLLKHVCEFMSSVQEVEEQF